MDSQNYHISFPRLEDSLQWNEHPSIKVKPSAISKPNLTNNNETPGTPEEVFQPDQLGEINQCKHCIKMNIKQFVIEESRLKKNGTPIASTQKLRKGSLKSGFQDTSPRQPNHRQIANLLCAKTLRQKVKNAYNQRGSKQDRLNTSDKGYEQREGFVVYKEGNEKKLKKVILPKDFDLENSITEIIEPEDSSDTENEEILTCKPQLNMMRTLRRNPHASDTDSDEDEETRRFINEIMNRNDEHEPKNDNSLNYDLKNVLEEFDTLHTNDDTVKQSQNKPMNEYDGKVKRTVQDEQETMMTRNGGQPLYLETPIRQINGQRNQEMQNSNPHFPTGFTRATQPESLSQTSHHYRSPEQDFKQQDGSLSFTNHLQHESQQMQKLNLGPTLEQMEGMQLGKQNPHLHRTNPFSTASHIQQQYHPVYQVNEQTSTQNAASNYHWIPTSDNEHNIYNENYRPHNSYGAKGGQTNSSSQYIAGEITHDLDQYQSRNEFNWPQLPEKIKVPNPREIQEISKPDSCGRLVLEVYLYWNMYNCRDSLEEAARRARSNENMEKYLQYAKELVDIHKELKKQYRKILQLKTDSSLEDKEEEIPMPSFGTNDRPDFKNIITLPKFRGSGEQLTLYQYWSKVMEFVSSQGISERGTKFILSFTLEQEAFNVYDINRDKAVVEIMKQLRDVYGSFPTKEDFEDQANSFEREKSETIKAAMNRYEYIIKNHYKDHKDLKKILEQKCKEKVRSIAHQHAREQLDREEQMARTRGSELTYQDRLRLIHREERVRELNRSSRKLIDISDPE